MRSRKSSIILKGKYPEKIRERYARLREELPYHITIRKIRGNYYIVRQEYVTDKENGKRTAMQEYLGKITEEGMFIVKAGNPKTELEVAEAVVRAHGGKISMPQEEQGRVYAESAVQLTAKEEDVLTNLTMNARMPIDMLSKNTGMSGVALPNIITKLARKLDITYVPDIRLDKLGFVEFFIFVKFLADRPNPDAVKADLEKISNIQFAAHTTGLFDMALFVLAEGNENLAELLRAIKRVPSLIGLKSTWVTSYFYKTKSFIPLRLNFFEILEKHVWSRSKETPRPLPNLLLKGEKMVLKSLVNDGAVKFAEIERQNGLAKGSARHIYDRLMKKGILPRVTIDIGRIGLKYEAAIVMHIKEEDAFLESRKSLLEFIMEEEKGNVINRFSLVGDISNPEGGIFFIPVVKGNELQQTVSEMQSRVKGIEISTLVIDSVMFGRILRRRVDPLYGGQYIYLVSDYKVKFPERRIYDEETFYRIEKIQSKYEKFKSDETE